MGNWWIAYAIATSSFTPHGFAGPLVPEEYLTIFPTKTIDYLLSQRPILAHMPADSFIAEFYRRHDCALVVDEPAVERLEAPESAGRRWEFAPKTGSQRHNSGAHFLCPIGG